MIYGYMIPRLPVGGLGSPFLVLVLSGKVVLARCLATKLHIIFLFSGSVCQDGLQWLGHGSKSYLFVSEGFRLLCCGGNKVYYAGGGNTVDGIASNRGCNSVPVPVWFFVFPFATTMGSEVSNALLCVWFFICALEIYVSQHLLDGGWLYFLRLASSHCQYIRGWACVIGCE